MVAKRKNAAPDVKNAKKQKVEKAVSNTKAKKGSGDKKKDKKPAVDPVIESLNAVRDAIAEKNEEGGEAVTNLVTMMLEPSLKTKIELRHPFQTRAVEMVEQLLVGIQDKLKKDTAEQQNIIDTADDKKQSLEAEKKALEDDIEAANAKLEACEQVVTADLAAFQESADAKDAAEKDIQKLDKEQDEREKNLEHVMKGFEETYKTMRDTDWEAGLNQKDKKKKDTALNELLKKIKVDASLLAGAPAAINRPEAERGNFDKVTIDMLDKQFQEFIDGLNEASGAHGANKAAADTKMEETIAAVEAAQQKLDASQKNEEDAKAEKKSKNADKKSKDKEISAHEKAVDAAQGQKGVCEGEESDFSKVMEHFNKLKNATDEVVENVVDEENMEDLQNVLGGDEGSDPTACSSSSRGTSEQDDESSGSSKNIADPSKGNEEEDLLAPKSDAPAAEEAVAVEEEEAPAPVEQQQVPADDVNMGDAPVEQEQQQVFNNDQYQYNDQFGQY